MDLIPFGPSTLLGGHRRPQLRVRALCPIDLLVSLVMRDGDLRVEDPRSFHSAVDHKRMGSDLGPGTSGYSS